MGSSEQAPSALGIHVERLHRDGFTIVANTISAREASAFASQLAEVETQLGSAPSETDFEGRRTVRVPNLVTYSALARKLAEHSLIVSLIEAYLGADPLLSSITSVTLLPGQLAQPIHVDDLAIDLPRPRAPLECTVMWAITDFTERNGATRLVPESHKLADVPKLDGVPRDDPDGLVAMEMPAGSALVYDAAVWHGAGENASASKRVGVGASYCRGWMRAHENHFLAIPEGTVRHFSERLKRLCGYSIYGNVLGHVEGREPAEALGWATDAT